MGVWEESDMGGKTMGTCKTRGEKHSRGPGGRYPRYRPPIGVFFHLDPLPGYLDGENLLGAALCRPERLGPSASGSGGGGAATLLCPPPSIVALVDGLGGCGCGLWRSSAGGTVAIVGGSARFVGSGGLWRVLEGSCGASSNRCGDGGGVGKARGPSTGRHARGRSGVSGALTRSSRVSGVSSPCQLDCVDCRGLEPAEKGRKTGLR